MGRTLLGCLLALAISQPVLAAKPALGEPAPNFTLNSNATFNLRLSEQKGHVVVLVFWASWCRSCPTQLNSLSQLQSKYEPYGVKVWGISLDKNRDDAEHYLKHNNLNFTMLYDDSFVVSEEYDIDDLPASMIVDRNGIVRHTQDGFEPTDIAKYDEILQKLVLE